MKEYLHTNTEQAPLEEKKTRWGVGNRVTKKRVTKRVAFALFVPSGNDRPMQLVRVDTVHLICSFPKGG